MFGKIFGALEEVVDATVKVTGAVEDTVLRQLWLMLH